MRPSKNLKKLGKWAVVTGGSDGIGLAYAEALAAKKMSVCLVARNKDKLEKCVSDIKSKFKVDATYIVADMPLTEELKKHLAKSLADLGEIGVLINNVGVSYDHAEYLHELDDARIKLLIQINIEATTAITKMVLPG